MVEAISNVQSVILQAAACRDDRVLSVPKHFEDGAAEQIAAKFLQLDWVREIKAVKDKPVWRRDATTGAAFALKLTRIGMIAAAALPQEGVVGAETSTLAAASAAVEAPAPVDEPGEALRTDQNTNVEQTAGSRAPRVGSKLDQVLSMLKADGGATIQEIMVATDWLPHSTRAVLTGLRKRGYALTHSKAERLGASVYRVGVPAKGLGA